MLLWRCCKAGLVFSLLMCLLNPSASFAKMLVGVVFSGNIPYYRSMHVAFLNELKKDAGVYQDIKFVTQFPAPDPVALSNSAKKLVVGGVDLIISYGQPATSAILAKESDIPHVYVGVYDPESVLAKKGPVTGCGYTIPVTSLLRYYTQIKQVERIVVVYSANEKDSVLQVKALETRAEEQKLNLLKLDFRSRGDLKKLEGLGPGDAVFMTGSVMAHLMVRDIMALMRENLIPVVDVIPDSSEEGLLVTFHHDPLLQGQSAAEIVKKIIAAGEKAGNIEPVVLSQTELVVSLREARNLGVSIPEQLVAEAARVIQ